MQPWKSLWTLESLLGLLIFSNYWIAILNSRFACDQEVGSSVGVSVGGGGSVGNGDEVGVGGGSKKGTSAGLP
jgi:hypothetical protein